MQFGLTEEQEMIVSTVRSFVENEIYPHEDEVERIGEVRPEVAGDTAGAAKRLAEHGGPGDAVIASIRAAEIYGLDVVRANVTILVLFRVSRILVAPFVFQIQ